MRCDNCGQNEAIIHLTQIVNDEMTTYHLCDDCATEKGLETGSTSSVAPLTDFLAQMGKSLEAETPVTPGACSGCGLTLADFKRTGRLGCALCYTHFGPHLRGLLRRLHGGTQHAGKVFLPPDPAETDRVARVVSLRRSLQRAVETEDFERAAALRDQIRRLETAG